MASRRHSTATCKGSNSITEEDIKRFDKDAREKFRAFDKDDAREMFKVFDKDGDKMISVEELSKALKSMGARLTYKEVQIAAKEIDKDKNGKIDYKEFRDFLIPRLKRCDHESQAREAFQIFDRDGNGVIDRRELKLAMKALGEEVTDEDVDDMLIAADINGDGKISYEEFSGIWEAKMREQDEEEESEN